MTSFDPRTYIHTTVKEGEAELSVVSDGTMRIDGGALYGVVPKVRWSTFDSPDGKNRVTVGLNSLLIRTGGQNILVDTGCGNKHPTHRQKLLAMKAGKLGSDLKAQGLGVEDIDLVVLTHLHFDHVGGCTRRVSGDKEVATFPKATYLVQQQEWFDATHTSERTRYSYFPEDFLPLEESSQLKLIDGDTEIAPNVWLSVTGGHTAGHQMVLVETGGHRVAYLGDLLPTHHHLPLPYIASWDAYPSDTLESKRRLLAQAEEEHWLLFFGHGVEPRSGYLVRRDGRIALDPQEL